jgi:glutamate racemase
MKQTIGIFDSGIGGLTILSELLEVLPNHDYIYIGDNLHCPYGDKSKEELMEYATNIIDYLIKEGVSLIVIACNTISSNIFDDLVKKYSNIKLIGVIDATVNELVNIDFKSLLVIATNMTIKSNTYQKKIKEKTNKSVYSLSTASLVPLIESNDKKNIISELHRYLDSYINKIDTILLGCTHYPIIIKEINEITNNKINIIDSGKVVASEVKGYIKDNTLGDNLGKVTIYTTGDVQQFFNTSRAFFNYKNISVNKLDTI